MGVAGLWPILKPAGQQRALPHLALVDGFDANRNGKRGYRVGIDASLWFFHAQGGKEGENPDIRTLFFRCAKLLRMPFLPIFVFDGPMRPAVKRGKRIAQTRNTLETSMRNMIKAFGFECRSAPGEAEAELAWLNIIGVIDAVLSDDVDTFLFGGKTVVRNPGSLLSSNRGQPLKRSDGKEDKDKLQAVVFTSDAINSHPDIQLTRGGLILIGLMSGGDYDQSGLLRCGPKVAHGLARCGFGDTLLTATHELSREQLVDFLITWRHEIRHELKTNSRGFMGRKSPSLAKSLPESFPNIEVLLSYVHPVTSASQERGDVVIQKAKSYWTREPDLGAIASICEQYFEWGVKESIVKRFRTVMWPGAVLRVLRKVVMDADARSSGRLLSVDYPMTPRKNKDGSPSKTSFVGTPSKVVRQNFSEIHVAYESDDEVRPLILKIDKERRHASTDNVLEYRIQVSPGLLVALTEAGVTGTRVAVETMVGSDEDWEEEEEEGVQGKKSVPKDPQSMLRLWIPASVVRIAEPGLVAEYEEVERLKAEKKAKKGQGRAGAKGKKAAVAADDSGADSDSDAPVKAKTKKTKSPAKRVALKPVYNEEEEEAFAPSQMTVTDIFGSVPVAAPPPWEAPTPASDMPMPAGKALRTKPSKSKAQATKSLFSEDVPPAQATQSVKDFYGVKKTVKAAAKGKGKAAQGATISNPATKINLVRDLFSAVTESRSTSTSQTTAQIASQPTEYKPKPFPLRYMIDGLDASAPSASSPVVKRIRQGKSDESMSLDFANKEDGGSSANPLTKSPRKSKSQQSPRSSMAASNVGFFLEEEEDEEDLPPRAASPSLSRPRPAGSTILLSSLAPRAVPASKKYTPDLDSDVLIISSDDDAPLVRARGDALTALARSKPAPILAPLLQAQARAATKTSNTGGACTSKAPKGMVSGSRSFKRASALAPMMVDDEVIDLT